MVNNNRLLWVDNAKVIGIYLVILGHGQLTSTHTNFIYSFHMPLFFMLSGYLFNESKYPTYRYFLKKKCLQLLVPYFILNFITFSLWLIFSRDQANKGLGNLETYRPVLGILYGNGIDDYLIHAVSLWFIICLFTLEQLYYAFFINKSTSVKFIIIVAFIVMGYLDYIFKLPRLMWGLNISLTAIVFYAFGNLLKNQINQFLNLSVLTHILILISFCVITYQISLYNGRIDINMRNYGRNYLLYYLGGIAGSLMILSFTKLFTVAIGKQALLSFIARNTISIIGFNIIAYHFISRIVGKLRGPIFSTLKNRMESHDLLVYILLSFIVLLMLLPVMYIMEKLFMLLPNNKNQKMATQVNTVNKPVHYNNSLH